MRDIKRQRRQIAQGSLPWGIANGKRKYRDRDSAVQRNDVIGPDLGRCVLLLQRLLTPSLPNKWMGRLLFFKLLKMLALPTGIELVFQP